MHDLPHKTPEYQLASITHIVVAVFLTMAAVLVTKPVLAAENMWGLCEVPAVVKPTTVPKLSSNEEMVFTADQVGVLGKQYNLTGKVEGRRGNQHLFADTVSYNKETDKAKAEGNVRYEHDGQTIVGDHADIDIGHDSGTIKPAHFWLTDRHIRGQADVVHFESSTVTQLEDGRFTTCDEGSDDWVLRASQLRLDTAKNEGIARHARLDFMHVPIFYFPYLSFALQGRKTGFLAPSIGDSTDSGIELSVPYYLNLAPNRDATLTANLFSRRGLLMEGEFRYLNHHNRGQLEVAHINNDRVYGSDRSAVNFLHQGEPAPGWRTHVEYRYISDNAYLDDFGGDLAKSSATHLERRANLNYRNDYLQANMLLQAYQTIDPTLSPLSEPYKRLPQLLVNTRDWRGPAGLRVGIGAEAVKFDRDAGVIGSRLDLQPRISWPIRGAAGFFVPKLGYRFTRYQLDKSDPTYSNTPSRGLPVFSVDSGLIFERELGKNSRATRQTLEPRLYYLNVPYRDQTNLIVDESGVDRVFDSSLPQFSMSQLFRENRFTGADRVGDANQLSAALTSRFLTRTGRELMSASLGRIFYFQDRKVTLPGQPVTTDSASDWVAEFKSHWTPALSTRASLERDPNNELTKRGSVSILYHKDLRHALKLAYRYEENNIEQGDIAFIWPLGFHWNVVGRWLHSLKYDVNLETLKGIEYESCCWTARIVQRTYRVTSLSENESSSIWLQLELKGLTSIGKPIRELLTHDILTP
jgi:LPS-assembly protein